MKCWTNLGDSLVKHRNVPIFSSAHCVISKHFGPKELRAKQRERAVCSLRLSVASNCSRHWVVALSFQLRTGTGKDYHKKPIGQAGIIFFTKCRQHGFCRLVCARFHVWSRHETGCGPSIDTSSRGRNLCTSSGWTLSPPLRHGNGRVIDGYHIHPIPLILNNPQEPWFSMG